MTLPYAAPYLLTGAKLALAYALIGIIGTEFIMSQGGMGFEIAFAYTNFDNAVMYPLIVLILRHLDRHQRHASARGNGACWRGGGCDERARASDDRRLAGTGAARRRRRRRCGNRFIWSPATSRCARRSRPCAIR